MIPEGEFFIPMDDVIDFVTTLQEKAHSDLRMGVYDFVKLMAVIERQNKSKKVGAREVCELVLLLRRRVRGDQGQ